MHLQENAFFDIKILQNDAQYPLHHVTCAPASLKLLHPAVWEEMHLHENTL